MSCAVGIMVRTSGLTGRGEPAAELFPVLDDPLVGCGNTEAVSEGHFEDVGSVVARWGSRQETSGRFSEERADRRKCCVVCEGAAAEEVHE